MFIRQPFATRIKVDEHFSIIDAIANIGGIMGLCMGFSLVTLVEVCYHIACLAWGYYNGNEKENDGTFIGRRAMRLIKNGFSDQEKRKKNKNNKNKNKIFIVNSDSRVKDDLGWNS